MATATRRIAKRLSPILLGVTFAGLASAVGAVVGLFGAALLEFTYNLINPSFAWKYDDPADQWVYDAYCYAGAAIGASAGILLGIWLTRRLLAARRAG